MDALNSDKCSHPTLFGHSFTYLSSAFARARARHNGLKASRCRLFGVASGTGE